MFDLLADVQNEPTPPTAEEIVRYLVVSLPLICDWAKEEHYINTRVDGIVTVNARCDIKRVCNVRCAVEVVIIGSWGSRIDVAAARTGASFCRRCGMRRTEKR